jgi:phenylalanyl-tRNA synthetase beta chain
MLVSLSWLRELIPSLTLGPAEVTSALDSLGLVVEGVEHTGGGDLAGVIVVEVVAIRPHPNADKVRLIDVRVADGADPIPQIACGAWNFNVGDRVPLATLGTVMPSGLKIEARKLRGEPSNGMLCSGPELGLTSDASGLMILPASAPLGKPIQEALDLQADAIFDVNVEANRPDAMSVRGIARDLAAKLGLTFTDPVHRDLAVLSVAPRGLDTITAHDLCDRLTTTVIEGVQVVPSPQWIQDRLTAGGMRPISNLVDASNYVMLEMGIPSHAFDIDALAGHRIGVRWAVEGETLMTLDGKERTLSTGGVNDGVIQDGTGTAVAIAGVMGGMTSEVTDGTTRLLLEIAHWTPMAIARTSKKLGLRSEASARYERNADGEAIEAAAVRFCELVRETCPDLKVVSFDDVRPSGVPAPRVVRVRTDRVNLVLGTKLDDPTVAKLLEPIGFVSSPVEAGLSDVTIPSWRTDATEEINVIEEVGRHFGYDNIERVVPLSPHIGRLSPKQRDRRAVRALLAGRGIHEAWTTTLIGEEEVRAAGIPTEKLVRLSNPLVAEEAIMRPSLLPGLLRALKHNANHRNGAVRLFETGRVFGEPRVRQIVPYERERLSVVFARFGDDAGTAKQAFEALCSMLGVQPAALTLRPADNIAGLHPTRSATIIGTGTGFPIGSVGEIDPGVLSAAGIDGRVGWFDVDLENLFGLPRRSVELVAVSIYPSSDLDLAFVTPDSVMVADLADALSAAAGSLCESVELFDVYRGKGVAEGHRSLAFRLRFVSADRTLSEAELTGLQEACVAAGVQIGASLRA